MKLTTALASFFLLAGFSAAAPIVELNKREAEANPTPQVMGAFLFSKPANETCSQLEQSYPSVFGTCYWTEESATECYVMCAMKKARGADAQADTDNNLEKREADPTPQIMGGLTVSKPANETCDQLQQSSYSDLTYCYWTQTSPTECTAYCAFERRLKRDADAHPESVDNLEKREADPTPQIMSAFTVTISANETCSQVQETSFWEYCFWTQISSTECSVDCMPFNPKRDAEPEPKTIAALDGEIESRAAADVNE